MTSNDGGSWTSESGQNEKLHYASGAFANDHQTNSVAAGRRWTRAPLALQRYSPHSDRVHQRNDADEQPLCTLSICRGRITYVAVGGDPD